MYEREKAGSEGDSTPQRIVKKSSEWVFDCNFMTACMCVIMLLYRHRHVYVRVVPHRFVCSLVSDSEHNKLTCCS